VTVGWYSNGAYMTYPINVTLLPADPPEAVDLYHELGKYLGIAAMALLLIGYFTGGTGFFKKLANRLFGNAAKRTKFHCAMSYELMALSLFHFGVLFYGPFSQVSQILVWQTVLGILAMGIMFVIALNGILQKALIKKIGYQNWRRVHAWGSYLATSLVIIHALTIGTHFLWFRELTGLA
jgi:predicted ferric reductase